MLFNIEQLKGIAKDIRKMIISVAKKSLGAHVGSSLSAVEIMTYLYFYKMRFSEKTRDRFILSKGHAGLTQSCIANKLGLISDEELYSFNGLNSNVSIHLNENKLDFVDLSTGSLGQGESVAVGWALGNRLLGKDEIIYCLLGDGELDEGSCWEAFLSLNKYKLNNIITLIDKNNMMLDGFSKDIMPMDNLKKKLEAFNFNVISINGHDFAEIDRAIEMAENSDMPTAIILNTVKGKGVSYVENNPKWHYLYPTEEQYKIAIEEIENGWFFSNWK